MKALVTGASGFIGSTLIEELGTLGFEVQALMRSTSSSSNLENLKFNRVPGDLSDLDSLRSAVKNVDYVFHLAGATAAPNRAGYFAHNTEGTKNLAEAVAELNPGLTRFVFVSSIAAGGPSQGLEPRTEQEPDAPVSAYGESKLAAEKELLKHKSTFPISIVRPPIVYGPKDKGVFIMIQTVARNLMPLMQGANQEGEKYYSVIHVRDLVRGLVQSALVDKNKLGSGEIFYVSDGQVHTYQQLMSMIADKLNMEPLKIKVPRFVVKGVAYGATALGKVTRKTFALNLDKLNELLPDYWICSNTKAKKILGFNPEFDLSAGMADAIEWYKKKKWI